MNPLVATVVALVRRIATLAGSAVVAFVIENLVGWTEQGFLADPSTAVIWPIVYVLIEAVQKYLRERRAFLRGGA